MRFAQFSSFVFVLMVNIRFQCLKISTALLSFLSHLKNATGSLSFLAKIVLSYWILGVFSSLSFFNFGKKKACYNHLILELTHTCSSPLKTFVTTSFQNGSGALPWGGDGCGEPGQLADPDVEVRAGSDRGVRVPPSHFPLLHDRDQRGHICSRKLPRRKAIQGKANILLSKEVDLEPDIREAMITSWDLRTTVSF